MQLTNLFTFSGRIGRGEYWLYSLLIVVPIFLAMVDQTVGVVAFLIYAVASLSASARRWHDRGKSGAWVLIGLIPVIGPIWGLVETGFLAGLAGPNTYGLPDSGSVLHKAAPQVAPMWPPQR